LLGQTTAKAVAAKKEAPEMEQQRLRNFRLDDAESFSTHKFIYTEPRKTAFQTANEAREASL
jgi:hypothetical protein